MRIFKMVLTIAACCALGFIIYNLSGCGSTAPPANEPGAVEQEPAPAPETPNTASEAPASTPSEQAAPESETQSNGNFASTNGIAGEKLHEIMLSATEFYNDTAATTPNITQNGFLCAASTGTVISQEYLIEREYLLRDYAADGTAILYVAPKDVAAIAPDYDNTSEEYKVFAALPFEEGYLLDAKGFASQMKISNDDFGNLLLPYRTYHGETRRVTGSTEDYGEIAAAISEFQGVSSEFYVRYGMRDDKYAVMIVSPKNDYGKIRQYVLENENGKWQVRIPNLETVTRTMVVVNNVLPDLSITLMPSYDVASYSGLMQKDFGGVSETLIRDGYLTEEEATIKYISATDKFLFAKYEGGQMFVGEKNGNTWVLGQVETTENALGFFRNIDENAPDFVIIWE